jgi:hypothetical protein
MNIYSQKGTKVECISNQYREQKLPQLKIGEIYTIEKTIVHSFITVVYLQEMPGVKFNSVLFINLPGEVIDPTLHQDYRYYHGQNGKYAPKVRKELSMFAKLRIWIKKTWNNLISIS